MKCVFIVNAKLYYDYFGLLSKRVSDPWVDAWAGIANPEVILEVLKAIR